MNVNQIVSLLSKAFVGDTIFQGSVGTWQYPGGNADQLVESIYRILDLPEETKLLSGHSNPWTVGKPCATPLGAREPATTSHGAPRGWVTPCVAPPTGCRFWSRAIRNGLQTDLTAIPLRSVLGCNA